MSLPLQGTASQLLICLQKVQYETCSMQKQDYNSAYHTETSLGFMNHTSWPSSFCPSHQSQNLYLQFVHFWNTIDICKRTMENESHIFRIAARRCSYKIILNYITRLLFSGALRKTFSIEYKLTRIFNCEISFIDKFSVPLPYRNQFISTWWSQNIGYI